MIAHAAKTPPTSAAASSPASTAARRSSIAPSTPRPSPYRYSVEPEGPAPHPPRGRRNDWEFLVIYHSHTHTEAYPSPTDVRLAAWPDAYYVLVSLMDPEPVVRAFRIVDGAVTEEPIEVPASA